VWQKNVSKDAGIFLRIISEAGEATEPLLDIIPFRGKYLKLFGLYQGEGRADSRPIGHDHRRTETGYEI
jgi:hypothetical protein